jgi:hypothetical protein
MKNSLFLFIATACISFNALSQPFIKVKGITTNAMSINGSIMKDVTVNIYRYNDKIACYQSDKNGKFEFEIEMNSYIMLEFVKEGFLSKKILFNTKNQAIDYSKNYIPFNFEIMMVEEMAGINYDDIDFPVTIIEYAEKEKEFLFVEKYTSDMVQRQEKVMVKIAQKY